MIARYLFIVTAVLCLQTNGFAQGKKIKVKEETRNSTTIIPAADQMPLYLPMLKGKKVALLVNHTSVVGKTHLIDTLLKLGINIKVIFGPEHGFRGDAPDGAKVETTSDAKTGIPVVSLYGKKAKPTPDDLKDVDVMVYDIQDVGTRYYTFIS